jgi:RNA polymerase sigma factor (sigma-70 family)
MDEDLLRALAPQVLGALVRRYGHFDTAEDATQEALVAAAAQWPAEGVPENPRGWLILVASRKLTDLLRSEQARTVREYRWRPPEPAGGSQDDSLILLFMCCHPALPAAAQIALTLRAVGGLTTAEIARLFLVPEDTMTRRITRAKQKIKDSGIPFSMPRDVTEQVNAVLHVLYLIFTEGYASIRADLSLEAIRLARLARRLLPGDGEVAGLLALMLLTEARRAARTDAHGDLVPLADQDRTLWNAAFIKEGTDLVTSALTLGRPGPYGLQAAIAALHDEDPVDWPQITALYELLLTASPDNPVIRLNHAVAVAMTRGPLAGLALLGTLEPVDYRHDVARAHLLELAGDRPAAADAYRAAAARAPSIRQQRYLLNRIDVITNGGNPERPENLVP